MNISKKVNQAIREAKEKGSLQDYVSARNLRIQISPFERYRIRLMGDIINEFNSLGCVLDVGCNIGMMTKFYKQHSDRIVLCDIDELFIQGAKTLQEGSTRVNFVCASAGGLPFKSGSFDTVVILETIEHLPAEQQASVLNEIVRVSKKNAFVFISTPNRFSLAGLEGKFIEFFVKGYKWDAWDGDHKYIYNSVSFINFLNKLPQKIEIKKIYGSYFLPGSLTVRMPLCFQRLLGALSYLTARSFGHLFPLRYLGFTIIAVFRRK